MYRRALLLSIILLLLAGGQCAQLSASLSPAFDNSVQSGDSSLWPGGVYGEGSSVRYAPGTPTPAGTTPAEPGLLDAPVMAWLIVFLAWVAVVVLVLVAAARRARTGVR